MFPLDIIIYPKVLTFSGGASEKPTFRSTDLILNLQNEMQD